MAMVQLSKVVKWSYKTEGITLYPRESPSNFNDWWNSVDIRCLACHTTEGICTKNFYMKHDFVPSGHRQNLDPR